MVAERGVAGYAGFLTFRRRGRKLSYYVYKKMAKMLEGSDRDAVQRVGEKEGIYIYKFKKDGGSIWVVWNDNPETEKVKITLEGGIGEVKVIEAIPHYKTEREVENYRTAFKEIKVWLVGTHSPQAALEIGAIPRYIVGKK